MKIFFSFLLTFLFCGGYAQTPGAVLFNDAVLHEIHFNNVDTTIFIGSENYQLVTMIIDGVTVDSIGFKKKGNISAAHPNHKFPFKIKTNKYVSGKKYDDIKEFTLHNSYQDPTYMREKMTYDICKEMGLYALRSAFAKVYINGNYWGLYTLLEGKDQLFKLQFNFSDGDAIESLDFGNMCYMGSNPADYDYNTSGMPYYILDNGNPATAWSNFVNMLHLANNTPNANYLSTVSSVFNLKDFFTYQAVNVYLLNFDSYIGFLGNQIYYYDTTNTMWQVIPWDFNASMGLWETSETPSTYPILPNRITTGCIASKMQNIPALRNYYMDAMCLLHQSLLDTVVMNDRIDQLKNQIQAAVYSDWRKMYSNTEFDNTLEYGYYNNILIGENIPALKTFFTDRYLAIRQGIINENYNCPALSNHLIESPQEIEVQVFPNPSSNGHFNLQFVENNDYSIQVFNSIGQKVQEKTILNSSHTSFNLLEKGIYFLAIEAKNGAKQHKTIVVE